MKYFVALIDLAELNRLETYYIQELNSMEQGYNSTVGGDNCYKSNTVFHVFITVCLPLKKL